jgi:hypothetical protein
MRVSSSPSTPNAVLMTETNPAASRPRSSPPKDERVRRSFGLGKPTFLNNQRSVRTPASTQSEA